MKPKIGLGDEGKTDLIGKRVWKDDLRIEILGKIDELNSFLGLAKSKVNEGETKKLIENVQKKLFAVGSIIAGHKGTITRDDVDFVEKEIKKIEKKLTPINDFVIPSGELSSLLHICRVKCREVERSVVSLHKKSKLPAELIAFMNRLSDLFFVLSRVYEKK